MKKADSNKFTEAELKQIARSKKKSLADELVDEAKAVVAADAVSRKPKYEWYDYIAPTLGVKWGAEITLIGYGWLSGSEGLKIAAAIVTAYLFLEWCQMAWCEFKRRAK